VRISRMEPPTKLIASPPSRTGDMGSGVMNAP
jgi:hypothetical protein